MPNTNTAKSYEVRIVTVVDRPLLRPPGMTRPPAGTRVTTSYWCATQRQATSEYALVMRGEYDGASEYARSVQVLQHSPGRSPRVVRRRVERAVDRSDAACGVTLITWIAARAHERGNTWRRLSARDEVRDPGEARSHYASTVPTVEPLDDERIAA